jgi:hypothetical protein
LDHRRRLSSLRLWEGALVADTRRDDDPWDGWLDWSMLGVVLVLLAATIGVVAGFVFAH